MKRVFSILLLSCLSSVLLAQAPDQSGPRRPAPGDRVFGKVTAVDKNSVTITPMGGSDGSAEEKTPVTITVTENTRINKQREPIKLTDIKPGDTVFAGGHRDGATLQANVLGVIPPEMATRFATGQGARGGFGGPNAQFNPDDMGKKFILGTVKAIDETKLTIARTDGKTQEIEVDENTSFRKAMESITLPDIKVGDFVMGRGELKNNVFVPKTLNVGPPQRQFNRGAGGPGRPGPASGTPAPTDSKPKDAPPQPQQ